MNYVKLQVCCLIIVVYIDFIYIWQTARKFDKIPCNPIFDFLMALVPWLVIFDGLTAWTVNHLELVPRNLNLVFHAIFFVLLTTFLFVVYLHTLSYTRGIPKKMILKCLILVPVILSYILILIFLPDLDFVIGKNINYSFGVSVIVCYVEVLFYYILVFACTLKRIRSLEVRKRINVLSFLVLTLLILVAQMIFPEILISSLVPTFSMIALYINIEDPALRRIKNYNNDIVTSFATLVESRDNSTGSHVKRTKNYVKIILDEINKKHLFSSVMSIDFEEKLLNAAPMHDIGKISTPDVILQKPGKLTEEEYNVMKKHAALGGEIIREIFKDMEDEEFLQIAYDVARYHHEKWNGKGYPEGLKGTEIPFAARIMAVADVFDAISANRCYRSAMPLEKCFQIIKEGEGSDFDPQIAELFLEAREKVVQVYNASNEKK